VLLRGARIDRTGTLIFADQPADLRDVAQAVTQPCGETRAFYTAVLDPGAIQGGRLKCRRLLRLPATLTLMSWLVHS